MLIMQHVPRRLRHPEQGVVLVVVLIFLVTLTTLAVFSSRNATLGERQARNEMEYQVARQAAEAALRDAEVDLRMTNGDVAAPNAICTRGGLLRTAEATVSDDGIEFTDTCLMGQCRMPQARYEVAYSAATTANPGQPWWPRSKGGLWNDNLTTKPSRSGGAVNCSTFTGAVSLGVFTGTPALPGVARQPEYLIEYINPKQDANLQTKDFRCTNPIGVGSGATPSRASADETASAASSNLPTAPSCHLFRVTARGFGASTRSATIGAATVDVPNVEIVLQTYYHVLKPLAAR